RPVPANLVRSCREFGRWRGANKETGQTGARSTRSPRKCFRPRFAAKRRAPKEERRRELSTTAGHDLEGCREAQSEGPTSACGVLPAPLPPRGSHTLPP